MNLFRCVAGIAERDALRYTPAGIPIVSARLHLASEQVEAGMPRTVELEMAAVVAGEIAGRFCQADLGDAYRFTGFLARKNRNSRSLVFHVTEFEACPPRNAS
ncbi:MAG: primosomal replication protein N [Burkholderiaceae bacterium]